MDNSDDINLDDLSPEELAGIEEGLLEQLRIYFRHLVGIAGAYEHVDPQGKRTPQQPFYYSAVVLEIGTQWFLATAGHNVEKLDAAATRQDMRLVACGLDDTYATDADHKQPIPCFDYAGASRFYRNDNGLDFGLIHLRKNYRDLLAANGIQPLSAHHWDSRAISESTTFLMVGFPEDSISGGITYGSDQYVAHVKGRPSVIWIDRLFELPAGLPETDFERFIGKIRTEHDVGNIAGMSGGPIYCFKGFDFEPYYVAALQSSWFPNRKVTFGCPFTVFLDVAREFISSVVGD